MLDVLRSRPGAVWTRRGLLEAMHGKTRGNVQEHAVDMMVSRIRKELGATGVCLESVYGWGFRWNPAHLSVDRATGAASVGGRPIDLTADERAVLAALASRPGRILVPGELAPSLPEPALRSIVASIQIKLGAAGACVETVRSRGYRFRPRRPATGRLPPSVRRTFFLLALGVLLAAAGFGALRVYRAAIAPSVLADRQRSVSATNAVPCSIPTNRAPARSAL